MSVTTNETPDFLVDFAPARAKRRLLPLVSRTPVTAALFDVWHKAAERDPKKRVVVDRAPEAAPEFGTDLSYGLCAQIVDQLTSRLYGAGVRPTDRVAIVKRNHLDVALLASASARLGAIPALISDNHDRDTLQLLLNRLQGAFLVTDEQAVAKMGIDADLVAQTKLTISLDEVPGRTDIVPWEGLSPTMHPPLVKREPDAPQVITHTSGTTGPPKLVMHSVSSLYALALLESERWPFFHLRADDTVLFCDPYCHQRVVMGLFTMATVTPTLICLSDPADPGVRDTLVRYKPTFVETLPNGFLYWEPLTKDPAEPFARVRVFASSFDGIHTRTVRAFLSATKRHFPLWVQSWSQTEAGAVAVRAYTRSTVRHVGRRPPPTQVLGWPVPGYAKLRSIALETGRPARTGEVGLIQINSPGRCLGYVGEKERYDSKVDGTWWDLGDLGIINKWGAVRLIDREVDRIRGASALEIEDLLLDRLPDSTEVIVLAVHGTLPQPVVSTIDDEPLAPETWCAASADLPPMARPIYICWNQFPRTATWKVQRNKLREQLVDGATAIGTGRWT